MLKAERARFRIHILSVERLQNGKEVEVEWYRSRKQRGCTVSTTVRDGEARWRDEGFSVETALRRQVPKLPKRSGDYGTKTVTLQLLERKKETKFAFFKKSPVISKVLNINKKRNES